MTRPFLFFSVIFILINCFTVKLNALASDNGLAYTGRVELAGRYTHVNPEKVHFNTGLPSGTAGDNILISNPDTDELTMGITKYLARHKIKAQGNIGYRITENLSNAVNPETNWILTFQIELGI